VKFGFFSLFPFFVIVLAFCHCEEYLR
jgi:hypothetical protein